MRRHPLPLAVMTAALLTSARSRAAVPTTGPTTMNTAQRTVATVPDLLAAVRDPQVGTVVVAHSLTGVPGLALSPGQALRGSGDDVTLAFAADEDGLRLSSDNRVCNLHLAVAPDHRAILNDVAVPTLGRIELHAITTVGRVEILAHGRVRGGHVEVDGLDIIAADATGEREGPQGYGVVALPGAFTLWNRQPDEQVVVTANLIGLSAGRLGRPVLGGGVFVAGAGEAGGRVEVQRLETGAVYSDGRIAPGTHDRITGGVGVWSGASADVVRCRGPVATYGPNDMALDNWGAVDRWTADDTVTTHGPSGIGFVNFGAIGDLRLDGPVETFGPGARGFNVYDGTVASATFDRIVTHGDGAVGVQISRPIGRLVVRRGIETFGGTGPSLVKGVVRNLAAIALSIKPGGGVRTARVDGGLRTHGTGVPTLEQEGSIDHLTVTGGFAGAAAGG